MPTPKALRRIARTAEKRGWVVRRTRRGHYQFVPPDRRYDVVHTGGTPSDHRSVKNLIAHLRRSGLDI